MEKFARQSVMIWSVQLKSFMKLFLIPLRSNKLDVAENIDYPKFRRFQQECEFMSAIKHPNIVQYLGTHQDPETSLPVLLMELMDDSLTHFLESSQDPVPYHIQVNFCYDITLAISYLHSNGIIHRDLSSNNVLLCGNVIAKVTDFGMAKLVDANPRTSRIYFTMVPGTDAYMPPEAVKDQPVYTAKIDCFAIGALIIQILTKQFPKPGRRFKSLHIEYPQFSTGTLAVGVSEIERRQNHISRVDPNHPLLPIALHCLKDSDVERPSAQELCHRVEALKETPQYTESARSAQEKKTKEDHTIEREEHIRDLQQQIQQKDAIIQQKVQQVHGLQQITELQNNRLQDNERTIASKQYENHQLRETINDKDKMLQDQESIFLLQKEQTIKAKQHENHQLRQRLEETIREKEERERQLQHVTQQLETSEQVMAQFQIRIQDLEQQLKIKSPIKMQLNHGHPPQMAVKAPEIRDRFELIWRKGKKAPCKMFRGSADCIVNGEMLYFKPGGTLNIYTYNSTDSTWNQLPDCPTSGCSLAVVDNRLTTIGGFSGGKVTNQLFSLTVDGRKRWRKAFYPMPTKRHKSAAICSRQALIIAGGKNQNGKILTTVEVMEITTRQWSTVADLPEPIASASATICGDLIYMLGGWYSFETQTKSVFACSLGDLFHSCQSRSLGERLTQSLSLTGQARSTVWKKVADVPVTGSTCVILHGRPLAIGGSNSNWEPTSDVRLYNRNSNQWEIVSKMTIPRDLCFAAVLPSNQIIVVGGCTGTTLNTETDSIELTLSH